MGVDTSSLLSCTYGSAGFMLDDFSFAEEPAIRDGLGRINTHFRIEGKGFFDADTPDDLITKEQAIVAAMRVDGQNFQITTLGGAVEYSILAANCMDGGPFCKFKIDNGNGPLMKRITFTLSGPTTSAQANEPRDQFRLHSSITPDRRLILQRVGIIAGVGSAELFQLETLAAFQAAFAAPNWIVNFKYDTSADAGGSLVNYTLSAEQTSAPMAYGLATGLSYLARDGETTTRFDADEQFREVFVYDLDYLITGSASAFHQAMRAQIVAANGGDPSVIMRESFSATSVKGVRVKSSFTILASANNDGLIFWSQTVTWVPDQPQYDEVTFIGADPIAALKPTTFGRIRQSGRAVGMASFGFPQEPAQIGDMPTRLPEITYEELNEFESQTTWSFESLGTTSDGTDASFDPSSLVRPSPPQFYGAGDGSGD
jgi:hypothetical protein